MSREITYEVSRAVQQNPATSGFDTRCGTVGLRVPKLRRGRYYPEWLFERLRRAERALVAVI